MVLGQPLRILYGGLFTLAEYYFSVQLRQDVCIEFRSPLRGLAPELSPMAFVPLGDVETNELLEREGKLSPVLDIPQEREKRFENVGTVAIDAEDIIAPGPDHPRFELGIGDFVWRQGSNSCHV